MNDSPSLAASRWQALAPYFYAILRIVVAFMFIQVGTAKVLAFPAAVMPGGGTAAVGSLAWIAGMLEIVGGACILLGLFTRPVAFILSGEMAVAYFMGHFPQGFWPVLNGGQPAIFYCFYFLYLSAAGAGIWSLDGLWARRVSAASSGRA